jgi:hypothetical protein
MKNRLPFLRCLCILLLSSITVISYGQGTPTDSLPGDPGALSVLNVQNMAFGAFSHGAMGGTLILSPSGARSVTGSVTALNLGISYLQAIFEIDAPEGSIISILNGPNATLTGSNGGSMILLLGSCSPGSPFIHTVASPARTAVSVGGTLVVGNAAANPPGTYSGTFYITFNQE